MKNLVIVESPTKAKTIGKFLDKNYTVKSSYGHVRDLPKSKMGVDFDNDFEPHYEVPTDSKKTVAELKKLVSKATQVYFATDEDREGEAISWHLAQLFDLPDEKVQRITFHEITKKAILEAFKSPHALNKNLVDAQQARRVLDRIVGYELSPLLWKKVAYGLSAGRVQSVAVRLIVEREREIGAFKMQEYWTVEGEASKDGARFKVALAEYDGKRLKKFDLTAGEAHDAVKNLTGATLTVEEVEVKEVSKAPPAPFTTSGLQIDANRSLGFSPRQTMMLAQQLYEGINLGETGETGLITYMRTDSVNLSEEFINATDAFLKTNYGSEYASGGRRYKSKSKNAQEAHEAIRPTDVALTPDSVKPYLDPRQLKLYDLIWRRTLASQMPNARLEQTSVRLNDKSKRCVLKATGSHTTFDGWQKVLPKKNGDEQELPKLVTKDTARLETIDSLQHFTQPPARYSEAGLVKALEERGIGRPSTYAPTIATIIGRKYVDRSDDRRLAPTQIGTLVNDLLVKHFPEIVDYDFTAAMENDLDTIANGEKRWKPVIKTFYAPFKKQIEQKNQELDKKEITEEATDQVCEKCGKPMVIKMGRFGRFLACTGYPECKNTKQIGNDGKPEEPQVTDEKCPECGKPLVMKRGRYGAFFGCSGYPQCKYIKKQQVGTGVTCPKCKTGEIVGKKSKRDKLFYSCNRYPECEFALWNKPTGETCPNCSSLLVESYTKAGTTIKCSNKECGYKKS